MNPDVPIKTSLVSRPGAPRADLRPPLLRRTLSRDLLARACLGLWFNFSQSRYVCRLCTELNRLAPSSSLNLRATQQYTKRDLMRLRIVYLLVVCERSAE